MYTARLADLGSVLSNWDNRAGFAGCAERTAAGRGGSRSEPSVGLLTIESEAQRHSYRSESMLTHDSQEPPKRLTPRTEISTYARHLSPSRI